MKAKKLFVVRATTVFLITVTFSQAVFAEHYNKLLFKVLIENQKGNCPSQLMSPTLKAACDQEIVQMKKKFDDLGSLQKVEYLGDVQSHGGVVESYKAIFANGSQYELVRKINISTNQVDAMRQIGNYYGAGYGLTFGSQLIPVGAAQPELKVMTDGT